MRLHHADSAQDHGAGEGLPAVVLLHAFPLDSQMFDDLVPLLAGRLRVVTVDLPGLGRSAVPADEPSMAAAADGVVGVLDALGIDSATVLGISTGGYVALELAGSQPDRVDALVLGSTTTRRIDPDEPDERETTADVVEQERSTEPVSDSADEGLGETAHRERPELVERLGRTIAAADPAGVAWMARAIASRADTSPVLAGFDGPVALVFGEEDTATPPRYGREMLALRGHHRSTTLTVLPATGHLTALESPQDVAAVVLDLVQSSPDPEEVHP